MGPVHAIVNFGRSFLFLSYLVLHQRVMSEFSYKPMDSESLVNETAYFNCSSSITAKEIHWYHYPVGVEAYQRSSVYAFGMIYKDYEEDFAIEKNSSSGVYNIVIQSVKPRYAGRYECQDNGGIGNSCSAQLIVLDDKPKCSSNINPDGVIGGNTCGIQPDELHLSCSISYHGNIPPELKWVKLGENDSISGNVTKGQPANQFTYNLTVKADLLKDKSLFECQTTKFRILKHSCTSEPVKLLYIFSAPSVSVKNIGEVVNCSANTSSQSCQYKWKWYKNEDTLTMSNNQTLKVNRTGEFRCEATCNIRDKQCTVNASLINATLNSSTNDSGGSSATAILVVVLICVLVGVLLVTLFIIYRRKQGHKDIFCGLFKKPEAETRQVEDPALLNEVLMQGALIKTTIEETNPVAENSPEESHPLLHISGTTEDNPIIIPSSPEGEQPEITDYDFIPTFLHAESLNSAEENKTSISGLTVLHKELFITFEKTSEVKVFQAIAFSPMRSFSVMHLDNPLDMVSCPVNNCLYISSPNKIYKVDATGKVIPNWPIEDGDGALSVTYNQTVILSDWKTTALREYSADGKLICEVRLPSDVHLFHAIKRRDDQYVVSFEHRMVHKVAIVDTDGYVIQSFNGMLKFPKYLTVNSDGYIFVADRNNSRVLMMNPTLDSFKAILSDKDKLGRPLRIYLDEENSRMFVADNKADNLRFIVYRLQKHKTGSNEDSAMNQAKSLEPNHNVKEDPGATEDTAVNQAEPLEPNLDLKEESGGLEDNSEVISDYSGSEEDEFHDTQQTLDESRGEKRKR